jgi:hypothetical protein
MTVVVDFQGNVPERGSNHIELKIDNGQYKPVASPRTITGLSEGAHTIYLRAVDQEGHVVDPIYRRIRRFYRHQGQGIINSKLDSYFPEADIRRRWEFYYLALLSFSNASEIYFYEPPSKAQSKALESLLEQIKFYFSNLRNLRKPYTTPILGLDVTTLTKPIHLFRHTMAQYYLAATNWSLAYVASLGGWENTEILNKCYGGIPEHIKAQIAKSVHVKFDIMKLNTAAVIQSVKF